MLVRNWGPFHMDPPPKSAQLLSLFKQRDNTNSGSGSPGSRKTPILVRLWIIFNLYTAYLSIYSVIQGWKMENRGKALFRSCSV